MKTSLFLLSMLVIGTLLVTSSCKKADIIATPTVTSQIVDLPKETLSSDELASLQQMREEEKLARDVYTTLFAKWGINVFINISSSEQQHTDAVLTLLNKYGLKDPVGNNAVGKFTNSDLQALYTQLVTQGNVSVLEAYKVGAKIEDLDIYDLKQALLKNDNQDIKYAYDLLSLGSRNHMRSFYSQILSLGSTYSAIFITQAEIDAIVTSPRETGSSW
ncbi:MAG: DUF2202 domain-containing protein [Mariniphaga sp.]